MAGSIEIVSSSLVRTTKNHPRTALDLTPLDLQFFFFQQIQKGILFRDKPPHSLPFAASLSRTLDFFPSLSGRLGSVTHADGTTSFFIDCNNAGAELTYAIAASVYVSDVLDTNYVPIDLVSSFCPLNGSRNYQGVSNPLLSVQITELADGCFIGCTANHMAMDGASFWHFFNSWAEISRGLNTVSKSPVFNPWLPADVNSPIRLRPRELSNENSTPDFDLPPMVDRVFHFSKHGLAKLKEKANSEAGCDTISTFQSLSAHLWQSVVRSRHKLHINIDNDVKTGGLEHHYPLIVDARSRIPLPDGYFGNAAYAITANEVSEHELLENGLGFAALKINKLVSRQTRESAIKVVEDWMKRPFFAEKMAVNFIITSSPRFDVYGCDFGWGKPIAARNGGGQRSDGRITVDPAPDSRGVCVVACLAPETMHVMEKDAEFMEFVSI